LAQRLLRRVCTGCSIERPISESEAAKFHIKKNTIMMETGTKNTLSSQIL